MTPAFPSRDLYRTATAAGARASALGHVEPEIARINGRCEAKCLRCHLEAKARLYTRAGDAAAGCADGGPETPICAAAAAEETTT